MTVIAARSAGVREDFAQRYLGPAEVVEPRTPLDPRRKVEVRLPSGRLAIAGMATPLPYEPCVGDTLLVIAEGEATWVIGVIDGKGRTVLELHGDVDLRALGGELTLSSDRAVRIDAPEVELNARTLRTIAELAVQKLGSLRQRVTDLLSVHAAQIHTVADGTSLSQAKTTTLLSEEKVTINGRSVHLG